VKDGGGQSRNKRGIRKNAAERAITNMIVEAGSFLKARQRLKGICGEETEGGDQGGLFLGEKLRQRLAVTLRLRGGGMADRDCCGDTRKKNFI